MKNTWTKNKEFQNIIKISTVHSIPSGRCLSPFNGNRYNVNSVGTYATVN